MRMEVREEKAEELQAAADVYKMVSTRCSVKRRQEVGQI